jgi:hypothetical protein
LSGLQWDRLGTYREAGIPDIMPTLNWIGKDAVVNHHKEAPFRLLMEHFAAMYKDEESDQRISGWMTRYPFIR